MSDLLIQELESQIANMRNSLAMMEAGGATGEGLVEQRVWIAELEAALDRYRTRNV